MKIIEKIKTGWSHIDWGREVRAVTMTMLIWVSLILLATCDAAAKSYPNITAVTIITLTFLIIRIGLRNQTAESYRKGFEDGYDKRFYDENEERYDRLHDDH